MVDDVNYEGMEPDWAHYVMRYWSPPTEKPRTVLMEYVGEEQRSYEGNDARWHLVFRVLEEDGVKYDPPVEWSTSSVGFAQQFKPIMRKYLARAATRVFPLLIIYNPARKEYKIWEAGTKE